LLGTGWFGPHVGRLFAFGVKLSWTANDIAKSHEMAGKPARTFVTRDEAVDRYLKVSGLYGLIDARDAEAGKGVVDVSGGYQVRFDPRVYGAVGPAIPEIFSLVKIPFRLAAGALDPMVSAADMRAIADSYGASGRGERVLIGEIYLPVDRLLRYYGRERAEVHLPFNFQLVDASWEARSLATLIANYEAALPPGAWPNWVLGNHDRPRVAAKRGQAQARVAAMLLLTLRGTPTLYYGDELGLSDVAIPSAQVQDPRGLREPGLALGRDPVRTPMPWDGSENAGFTTAKPWLPLNADWPTRNVARMAQEPHSILALYRRLLAARRAHLALAIGDFALLDAEGDVLAYERRHGAERLIVALNLGGHSHRLELPDWASDCRALLSTVADAALAGDGAVLLRADEGLILTAD